MPVWGSAIDWSKRLSAALTPAPERVKPAGHAVEKLLVWAQVTGAVARGTEGVIHTADFISWRVPNQDHGKRHYEE